MSHASIDHNHEEKFFVTNSAQLQRWLPWLRMFRAFRIAIGVKSVLLALVATCVLPLGDNAIRSTLGNPQTQFLDSLDTKPLVNSLITDRLLQQLEADTEVFSENQNTSFPSNPPRLSLLFIGHFEVGRVLYPWSNIPIKTWLLVHSSNLEQWVTGAALLLWGLLIYALFGGAISRITAHEITGTGSVSLLGSLKFSGRRLLSYFASPLLTLVGIGMCWLPLVCAGLIGRIPVAGEFLVGLFWIFAILAGFFLALILIGVTLGWPLMFTTISVEATDAFDGLSRSFSYIFNRPWYALFLVCIMSVYGVILSHFVNFVLQLSIRVTDQVVGVGLSGDRLSNDALYLVSCWMYFVNRIPIAFYFSFFWVSVTIIHFLLRHREDGTPFFVMGQDKLVASPLPLSGIPAAELREAKLDL